MFSLGGWSLRIPTGFHVSRGTWVRLPERWDDFAYRAITFCGGSFQSLRLSPHLVTLRGSPISAPQPRDGFPHRGLGCSPFARRYSGNRVFFLFLEVLRCFSSLGWPPSPMDSGPDERALPRPGFPIRASPDRCLLAAPRGLSQLATPFVASWRQGIHRSPLVA